MATGVHGAGGEVNKELGQSSPHTAGGSSEHHATGVPSRCSTDEVDAKMMRFFIELQSLLLQLTISQTRGDFLNGNIVIMDDPDTTLFTLDRLRNLLMPQFCASSLTRQLSSDVVLNHIRALLSRSDDVFFIPSGSITLEPYSYRHWEELLAELLVSSYWLEFSPPHGCEAKLMKMDSVKTKECHPVKKEVRESKAFHTRIEESSSSSHRRRLVGTSGKPVRGRQVSTSSSDSVDIPMEEIVIDSTDSSDDGEVDGSFCDDTTRRKMYKKVVTPHLLTQWIPKACGSI